MKSQRQLLTFASLAVLILAGAMFVSRWPGKTPVVREVLAGELTLREGRSYWKDETTPFSGIITESYPDGRSRSRSVMSNGLMHGVSEGWYTNGTLQVREHFVEGVSHGLREKWFENGMKLSEAQIKSGKLEGTFKRWHDNGALAEEIQMKDGNPDGVSVAYHPDGSLKAKATVQNGTVIEHKLWKPGELKGALTATSSRHGP